MSTDRDHITKFITNVPVNTNREVDEAVLAELIDNFDQTRSEHRTASPPNIWRVILKSRITQFTAATAIIVVTLIGVSKLMHSRAAFADVMTVRRPV